MSRMSTTTHTPAPYDQPREEHDSRRVSAVADDALGTLDATGVAAAIRSGSISATEAVEAAIARIASVNPVLGATTVDAHERARSRASHLPAGTSAPFAGVPSAFKDNVTVAGLPMRMG